MRGIFHRHGFLLPSGSRSVQVKGVRSFKTENNAPVGAHGHGPKPLQFAFERVQAITGKVESLRRGGICRERSKSPERCPPNQAVSRCGRRVHKSRFRPRCLKLLIIRIHRKAHVVTKRAAYEAAAGRVPAPLCLALQALQPRFELAVAFCPRMQQGRAVFVTFIVRGQI